MLSSSSSPHVCARCTFGGGCTAGTTAAAADGVMLAAGGAAERHVIAGVSWLDFLRLLRVSFSVRRVLSRIGMNSFAIGVLNSKCFFKFPIFFL